MQSHPRLRIVLNQKKVGSNSLIFNSYFLISTITTEQFIRDIISLQPAMRRMAVQILHDDDLAADAVQETLTRLWHRRWRLDLTKNPQGFSMNALRNECIDTLRHQRSRNTLAADPDEIADYQPSESAAVAREERYQQLEQAIAALPEQHQRLIRMKYVEQRSSREIAQITGLTESNVNTTMSRIYDTLRKQLDEKEDTSEI